MTDKSVQNPRTTAGARNRRGAFGLSSAAIDQALMAAVFVGVVLVIAAVGYLVYAAIARPVAPRTEVERRVYYYEQGVRAYPKRADLWSSYAGALIDAGQYSKASTVIADGLRKVEDKAGLLFERARLERAQGRTEQALKTADEVIAAVASTRKKAAEEALKKGIGAPQKESPEIIAAEILKAEVFTEQGKLQQAIDAYTRALVENPRMSDVLAARGDLHAKLGDATAARKDYRAALRYDPENAAALKGLETLGDADK